MGRNRAARPEPSHSGCSSRSGPEEAKDLVEEAFAPWREEFPKARWVPRENLHVTLKFPGRTWPRLTEWVPERIEEAVGEVEPFDTRLVGVGSFPSAKRGRAIWAGFDEPEPMGARGRDRRCAGRRVRTGDAPVPHLTVALGIRR